VADPLKVIGSTGALEVVVEYFEYWCFFEYPFEGLVPVGPKTPVELEVEVEFANVFDEDTDDDTLEVPTGPTGAINVDLDLLLVELLVLDFLWLVEEPPVLKGAAVGDAEVPVLKLIGLAATPLELGVLE